MRVFAFLAILTVASGIETPDTNAQILWRSQMAELDKIVEIHGLPKSEPQSANSRQIGLPFFGIEFEGAASDGRTVHTLRPEDIDVVAAMGDSITAANGAEGETVGDIGIEYRAVSWSVGGNATLEESITLPNILKKFNSHVDGYSYLNGPRPNQYPYGFNVAVPGARAFNMLSQAERLVELLKTDNRSKFETDWKLNSLFIGGNDLCAIGRDPEGTTPEVYVAEIKKGLDYLHANVPRMFVNIIDILEIYLLPNVSTGYGSTPQCRAAQATFCGYVVGTLDDPVEQQRLIEINKQYQIQLKELIDSGVYDTRDDFTVVIQPFLRDSVLPYTEDGEVDATYFAPDCFHFSDIGHAMGALNLWNNMLEPVGSKSSEWTITDLKVPTEEHPYIFTAKNSLPSTEPPTEETESSTELPGWVIALIVVFTVAAIVEFIALVMIRRNAKREKKEVDF